VCHIVPAVDDLSPLRAFTAVARTGSVGLAALELHLSQASVSRQLQRLEAALGAQLFHRREGRPLALTPAGQRILDSADAYLDELDRRWSRLQTLAVQQTERITIGLGPGMMMLPEAVAAMARFRSEHPDVESSVVERTSARTTLRELLAGEVDLAIAPLRAEDRSEELEIIDVLPLSLHVMMSAEHRLAGRTTLSIYDLAGETFAFREGGDGLAAFVLACSQAGVHPRIDHLVEDMMTLLALVRNNEAVNIGLADQASMPGRMVSGFALVPLVVSDPPDVTAAVFWRKDRPPLIPGADFGLAARQVAAQRSEATEPAPARADADAPIQD
jgi:DNA-binding transcriptional LysR family regulator